MSKRLKPKLPSNQENLKQKILCLYQKENDPLDHLEKVWISVCQSLSIFIHYRFVSWSNAIDHIRIYVCSCSFIKINKILKFQCLSTVIAVFTIFHKDEWNAEFFVLTIYMYAW